MHVHVLAKSLNPSGIEYNMPAAQWVINRVTGVCARGFCKNYRDPVTSYSKLIFTPERDLLLKAVLSFIYFIYGLFMLCYFLKSQ